MHPNRPSLYELMRQYMDQEQWYDMTTVDKKNVEDISFGGCITINPNNPY